MLWGWVAEARDGAKMRGGLEIEDFKGAVIFSSKEEAPKLP